MGQSITKFDISPPFILQDMLEGVAAEAADLIVEATTAAAALIWLPETASGKRPTQPQIERPAGELESALQDFLDHRCANGIPAQLGGVEPFCATDGTRYILTLAPLCHREKTIGVVSAAFPVDAWDAGMVFKRLTKVCDMAAAFLATARMQYQLEADLAEVNLRAQNLARLAEVDDLTQVENRASFEAKVKFRLESSNRPAALLALDLDDFKQVNDVFGHQFGDEYLRAIARALKEGLPPSAIVGRTGGDEFCILLDLPEAGRSYLESVTQQLRLSLRRNIAQLGGRHRAHVSIGVCRFPSQARTFEDLFRKADQALYTAKRQEKNGTVVYNPQVMGNLTDGADEKAGLPNLGRIVPYFQPIIDSRTGCSAGVELLARWLGEDPPNVSGPQSFAWMFRDARYASALTLEIVRRALAQLSELSIYKDGLPDLWINVTDCDLMCPEFVFDLQTVFTAHSMQWDKIVIEVNEASMLSDRDGQLFHTLKELRCRGARVALDDFGTGYAGLIHLSNWPVDIIKIDRSFVSQVDRDEGARVVIDALIMIAEKVGLQVVAEGVETASQLAAMSRAGCDYGQGFLIATPQPALGLEKLPEVYDFGNIHSLAS